jgi:hypothetical protein
MGLHSMGMHGVGTHGVGKHGVGIRDMGVSCVAMHGSDMQVSAGCTARVCMA